MCFKRAQLILAHGSNADEMLILIKERSQAVKINFYNKNLMFVVVTIQRQYQTLAVATRALHFSCSNTFGYFPQSNIQYTAILNIILIIDH